MYNRAGEQRILCGKQFSNALWALVSIHNVKEGPDKVVNFKKKIRAIKRMVNTLGK